MERSSLRLNAYFGVLIVTAVLLMIPLIAMGFTHHVNWDITDFIVMGALLMLTGSTLVFIAGKLPAKYRLLASFGVVLLFLYVWAELAVGIFTQLGS